MFRFPFLSSPVRAGFLAGRSAAVLALLALIAAESGAQQLDWVRPVSKPEVEAVPSRVASGVDSSVRPVDYQQRPTASDRRAAKQPTRAHAPKTRASVVPADHQQPVDEQPLDANEAAFVEAFDLTNRDSGLQQACHCGDGAACACEPGCECEPGCAVVEPGCEFLPDDCGCGDVACGGCGDGCVGCGDGVCSRGCFLKGKQLCFCLPPVESLVLFGGVQGFKNPLDGFRDRGNFGFNTGVNLGGPLSWFPKSGIGYQVGYRATFNQLTGARFNSDTDLDIGGDGAGDSDSHTQSFVTAGLFRRCDTGLQYGVVYDYLQDDRIESVDFNQVRGQVSILNPSGGEIGFLFASAVNEQAIDINPGGVANVVTFQASDQYLAFYRFNALGGGEFRVLAGSDSDDRGIVGADMLAPLNHSWSINTGFRYLIAPSSNEGIGSTQEAWNLGIDLVYHFHGSGKRWHNSRWRPLFGVADNGSLSVGQR